MNGIRHRVSEQYSIKQCITDAEASGLDADTLYEQVTVLRRRLMLGDEPRGAFLLNNSEGLSYLDQARLLAGVVVGPVDEAAVEAQAAPAAGGIVSQPAPLPSTKMRIAACSPDSALSEADPRQQAETGSAAGSSSNRGVGCALVRQHHPFVAAAAAGKSCAIAVTAEAALELQAPFQTSRMRRAVQHISATVQPLITPMTQGAMALAMSGASSSSLASSVAAAGMAGIAAGTQSMATHEHHTQSQDMSRNLQRVALEQDRKLHDEAQEYAVRLNKEAMAQEARMHRQGLWRERQHFTASMEQDRELHASSLRVDHRLHFEGILADLREQETLVSL